MSLRNQPYLPLYVQDFMTDEKLSECSAESTGVYIRLMCIMHKSEEYGTILLKQKDKQTSKQILNFATKLVKNMPYDILVIERSLNELIEENVIYLDGDYLKQRRMIKDCIISEERSKSGKKGGEKTAKNFKIDKSKNKASAKEFAKAKDEANSENENENENVIEKENKKITDLNKKRSAKKNELQFPYESENFKRSWAALIAEPKWRKKTHGALQASLVKLSKYSEQDAVDMMQDAIAGNYQGLFPTKKQNGFNDKRSQADQFNNAINAAVEDIFGSGSNGQQ